MRLSDLREDLTQSEEIVFVGGVYPRRHITMIASAPGTGKTWLILRHGIDIVQGAELTCGEALDDSNETPPKVLIFCGEAGGGIMAERLRKMGCDTPPNGLIVYTLTRFLRHNVPITLDSEAGINTFSRIVNGEHPDVVFIDTLISFREDDECDQKSTSLMLGNLRRIAEENNCAMVITHHLRKRKAREQGLAITQDDIIGTSAFTRLCSVAYTLSSIQFSDSILFQCVKSWWKKPEARAFRLQPTAKGVNVVEVEYEEESSFTDKCENLIARVMKGSTITITQMMEECGCSQSTASKVIKRACEDGVLRLVWQQNNVKYFQKM